MQRALLLLGASSLAVLGLGLPHYQWIQERLLDLEQQSAAIPARERQLKADIEGLTGDLAVLRRARDEESARGESERARLASEVAVLEAALTVARAQVASLDAADAAHGARTDARLKALENELETGWSGLRSAVDAAATLATETRHELEGLVEPSERERWRALVGPSVQLSGAATVGSGVLLPSRELEGGVHETLLLTAWHVVRDIRSDALEPDATVPVTIYGEDGSERREEGRLVAHKASIDVAVLVLECPEAVAHGASLARPDELDTARIFKPVVAVGCPLGNDPIPTRGELADTEHTADGGSYWMINAPAYIGNSGGGVFDARTHRVMGIFSKIYTHGSLRPTVVPHMGLVTPMDAVYAWIESIDSIETVETAGGIELRLASGQ